jgi:hypothetical protein
VNSKFILAASYLALLVGCGGSTTNPIQPAPTIIADNASDFNPLIENLSINSSNDASTGLTRNTTFTILNGEDRSSWGEGHSDNYELLVLTTDNNLASNLVNGNGTVLPPTASQSLFNGAALNNGLVSSTEVSPSFTSIPYGYMDSLINGEKIQIYADHTGSRQSPYATLSVSGPEFSQIPVGQFTMTGRSLIYRLDNKNSLYNHQYGAPNSTTMEAGTFTMSIDPDNNSGSFNSSSTNSSVVASNLNVSSTTGDIQSYNITIQHLGDTYSGVLYGNLHGNGEATSGIFASTDNQPTVAGAFAGKR